MLSSLLNASPVAPKVTPRPSTSPTKPIGNAGKSERPVDEDDDVVIVEEVSQLIFSSFLVNWEMINTFSSSHPSFPFGTFNMAVSTAEMTDEEFYAYFQQYVKGSSSSTTVDGNITPKPTSPRNPMSISSILPSTTIIPDTSPLSTMAPATSPPSPQRPNPPSSQVISDDIDMIDPSGDTADGLDTDDVEPAEDGDMDEDDEGEGEGEGEGDEDDDSEDEEDSEDDEDEDDEEAEVGFSSFLNIKADV
jgi:hypothetical protein